MHESQKITCFSLGLHRFGRQIENKLIVKWHSDCFLYFQVFNLWCFQTFSYNIRTHNPVIMPKNLFSFSTLSRREWGTISHFLLFEDCTSAQCTVSVVWQDLFCITKKLLWNTSVLFLLWRYSNMTILVI